MRSITRRFPVFKTLSTLLLTGVITAVFAQGTQTENNHFDLATRLFSDGSYANAAQEFKLFAINFPTSDRLPDAMLRLGQAYASAGQHALAVEAFQQFINRYPNRLEVPTAMRARATALEQSEEYIKAGRSFQDVYAAYPASEYAIQNLLSAGINYARGGAAAEAVETFQRLIRQHPQSPLTPEAIYNLGRVLQSENRVEEALAQFRALVEFAGASERKPDALLEIGKIALDRDDPIEAERVFADLRRRFPQSASAENTYLLLSHWHAERQDWASAEKIYQSAQGNLPRNTRRQQAVLGRANALRNLEKHREALDLYTEFLKAYPDSPFLAHARLGFGRTYADLKEYGNALQAFKRLQEEFPGAEVSIQAYNDIGNIWRALGAPQRALSAYRAYEASVQSPSDKATAQLHIAQMHETLGWFDLATENYRALIGATPLQYAAEGQFGLARVFETTGQAELALREYRAYLQHFSDGPRAETAETRIQLLSEFALPSPRDGDWFALLAALPFSETATQFYLGKFLYDQRHYRHAAERFETALSNAAFDRTPQARYLLADSYLKLARKAHLEGDPKTSETYRDKGLTAYKIVIEAYPDSDWADDAALSLIEIETVPDSLHARARLEAYRTFLQTYAHTDLRDEVHLRTADAHMNTGEIAQALKMYREVHTRATAPVHKERAAYGIGLSLSRQGDLAQAETALRNFLLSHPQSDLISQAQFQLGRILLDRQYYASAADEFAELLTMPSSLSLERTSRALLAECYFQLRDYPRAIEIDERLLRQNPSPDVLRRLGRSYVNDDQHELAVSVYTRFLRTFPNAADADSMAFARAERLSHLGRTTEAIAAFREFSEKYASSPLRFHASQAVGDLFFQKGDYADALTAYQRIPETARNARISGNEVLSLYRLNQVREADRAADRFKKTYKTETRWFALFEVEEGKYHLSAKNPKKARQIFENVIKNHPNTPAVAEASYYIARAYYDEGPDKEGQNDPYIQAITQYVRSFPDDPNWVKANLELAKYWEANEEYGSAARFYRNALEKGVEPSQKPDILFAVSQNYNNLRSYDLGISFARQLVREFPNHKLALEARLKIGHMLQLKGDNAQSIEELIPLINLVSSEDERASIRYMIAENYFQMGDYNNARREFLMLRYKQGISVNWIASAQIMIANCYAAQGNMDQAMSELQDIKVRFGATSTFGLAADKRIQELTTRTQHFPPGR